MHLSFASGVELPENRAIKMMKTSVNGMRILIYPNRNVDVNFTILHSQYEVSN